MYKSAAIVTALSTVEKTLSFAYRIVLSRSLGAEGLGVYQICLSVFAVFLTAASSGIPITVSRLIAKQSATGTTCGKHAVVSSGVLCTLAFTVPVAVALFFLRKKLAFLFPYEECVNIFALLLPALVLTSVYAVMRGAFWGNKQFLPYSLIELAEDAVMVICGCALISLASSPVEGAKYATVAVLISYIFSFFVSIGWYLARGGRFVKPKKQLKPLLAASLPITSMRTSTSLLNSVVAMFLPALLISACGYTNAEAVALYGVVLGMSVPMLYTPNSLIGSIAVVVAPEMSENFYAGKKEALRRDVERSVKTAVLIAAILIPVMYTVGEDLGIVFYDNEYSGTVIRRFSCIMLPLALSMMTTTILNSMNFEVKTLIHFFIGALALLGCIFAFTPLLGINAYMVGLSLNFVITAALNLRLLKKQCPDVNYFGYTIKSVLIAFAACVFGYLAERLFSGFLSPFFKIIVCGGAAFLFASLAFYALEMATTKPLRKLFARKKA